MGVNTDQPEWAGFGDDAFWHNLMNSAINSEFDGPLDEFGDLEADAPSAAEVNVPPAQRFPGFVPFEEGFFALFLWWRFYVVCCCLKRGWRS